MCVITRQHGDGEVSRLHGVGTPLWVLSRDSGWASPPLVDLDLHPFPARSRNHEDNSSHEICESFQRISDSEGGPGDPQIATE